MNYASEQLYNGYLRQNLATFVTVVRPTEIMVHLQCLTQSDRDEIYAKKESRGNFDAMQLLLDCLRRRENWPEQLIQALRNCEHLQLSREVEREYNSLRANMNGRAAPVLPSAAPHGEPPAPPAASSGGHPAPTPAPASEPPAAPCSGPPPPSPPAPSGTPPAASVHSPLSPVAVPPPSADANPSPAPKQMVPAMALTNNVAPMDPQCDRSPGDKNLIPSHRAHTGSVETQNSPTTSAQEVPATAMQATCSEDHVSQHTNQPLPPKTDTPTCAGPASSSQRSLVNNPVQETNPLNTDMTSVSISRGPVENLDPTANQVQDSHQYVALPQGRTALQGVTIMPPPANQGRSSILASSISSRGTTVEEEHLSKPGELQLPFARSDPEEPYSGDADRLEFSDTLGVPCRTALEDSHYESIHSSEDVYTNEIHVSEEASIQNHAGQSLGSQRESHMTQAGQNSHSAEGTLQSNSTSYPLIDNYYVPAAVVVAAACVLVLLWRLKE
ncbi:mitochondrial antiviral-signaling protein [Scleropages formosus]|uniref:mitochondrial antiviral-signaling protein n=1 Tax=Scleropages formosus TaxID=113540 RepID=UPI0010FAC26B|nr:mitochondrial antiviral-signaling protein [Scleropages formosus]XP_018582027.2 mitochondrial antiviral-signaling protein [Scleropages formosus]